MSKKRIAILGAGPVGLEAALAAAEAGMPFTLFEASDDVAGHIRSWGHVRLFTPWSMNVSPRMRTHLSTMGLEVPAGDECPTGAELVEQLLRPVAESAEVAPNIRYGTRVLEVSRGGMLKNDEIGTPGRGSTPFRLVVRDADDVEHVANADVVLDCTGTYGNPNPLGAGGIKAPGERGAEERIVRRIPDVLGDINAWAGRRILLVGGGHSGQTVARDLAELTRSRPDTQVVWALRTPEPNFAVTEDDPLAARAELCRVADGICAGETPVQVRTGCLVDRLSAREDGIASTLRFTNGSTEEIVVDRIIALTGSVGDARIYRQLQVHECWATSGPMKLAAALLGAGSADCLTQESHGPDTLKNPEPDFFILGAKSYGRNTTFLLRVGWDQVTDVFGLLASVPATA